MQSVDAVKQWLIKRRFEPVESSDGADTDGSAIPYVSVQTSACRLIIDTERLRHELRMSGIEAKPMRQGSLPVVQGVYDPVGKRALIMLAGVTDEDIGGAT